MRGLAEQTLEGSGMGGACREPGRRRRAAEAAVDEPPWESGSEGWCDGRWETVWCDGLGARGSDGVVPQASQSSGVD